jgi:hypothetical protein
VLGVRNAGPALLHAAPRCAERRSRSDLRCAQIWAVHSPNDGHTVLSSTPSPTTSTTVFLTLHSVIPLLRSRVRNFSGTVASTGTVESIGCATDRQSATAPPGCPQRATGASTASTPQQRPSPRPRRPPAQYARHSAHRRSSPVTANLGLPSATFLAPRPVPGPLNLLLLPPGMPTASCPLYDDQLTSQILGSQVAAETSVFRELNDIVLQLTCSKRLTTPRLSVGERARTPECEAEQGRNVRRQPEGVPDVPLPRSAPSSPLLEIESSPVSQCFW